jgi:2-polyprenyl-3-methyl-5-hydroxy-6-metoxy-1,4-benzoquinol methylase
MVINHNSGIDYEHLHLDEWPFAINLSNWIKEYIDPTKVIDVGCGPGTYVKALREEEGITAIGYDPDIQLRENPYVISQSLFDITDTADLIICLEVAEHIPEEQADTIISKLVRMIEPHGSIIFSAALPGQGGVGHINCQWKPYWEAAADKFLKS